MKKLKTIRLVIAFLLFFALTLSLSPVLSAPSNPKAQAPQPEKVVSLDADTPLCYMQTANGEVLDLSNLCNNEQQTEFTPVARRDTGPYDSARINQFDRELYGD